MTADRVALYRAATLTGRAVVVGDRDLDLTVRLFELRCDCRAGWAAIARRAIAHGRTWTVLP